MDKEKLLDALNVIQKICIEHECKNCPLRMNPKEEDDIIRCYLRRSPNVWNIKDGSDQEWRAFDD